MTKARSVKTGQRSMDVLQPPAPAAREVAKEEDKRVFTYAEAVDTLPRVRAQTALAVRRMEALVNTLKSRDEMDDRKSELERDYQVIIEDWAEAVGILGCEVKGLWLVDWDTGAGYYCWRYPEESLGYFHGYDEGFDGRIPIH